MLLIKVNQLGYLAGVNWLNSSKSDSYRRQAAAIFDNAKPSERGAIDAAWRAGWRFGFGPVKPGGKYIGG